jgi:hypothetical protein
LSSGIIIWSSGIVSWYCLVLSSGIVIRYDRLILSSNVVIVIVYRHLVLSSNFAIKYFHPIFSSDVDPDLQQNFGRQIYIVEVCTI